MEITLSLNRSTRLNYEEDPNKEGYQGSIALLKSFINRGHNVSIIHPEEVYTRRTCAYPRRIFGFDNLIGFFEKEQRYPLSGDVFFVYGLGEDTESIALPKYFIDLLYLLEKQYSHVLNSAESTSYEFKPKQKKLNLPWIPGFKIRSIKDLVDLINSGEKIIAKPSIGCAGKGIVYLENPREALKLSGSIDSYIYERFVPSNEERRYIFLDNELIIRRRTAKQGYPGKEQVLKVDLIEGNTDEIELAREIVFKLGMFYCAVDFRGDYLLEINGSGTGVIPPNENGQEPVYNLSSAVVYAVERKMNRNKNEIPNFDETVVF